MTTSEITWTARYRGCQNATLIDEGKLIKVDIVRVLKRQVIVSMDGDEMRYARDVVSGGCAFQNALREADGRVIYGRCPMLALPDDSLVETVRQRIADNRDSDLRRRILRSRSDLLYKRADEDALMRVIVALEEPRHSASTEPEFGGLVRLIGGKKITLSAEQVLGLREIERDLERKVSYAYKKGFECGKELLVGLNDGRFTLESFDDRVQHEQYHVDLRVERSQW